MRLLKTLDFKFKSMFRTLLIEEWFPRNPYHKIAPRRRISFQVKMHPQKVQSVSLYLGQGIVIPVSFLCGNSSQATDLTPIFHSKLNYTISSKVQSWSHFELEICIFRSGVGLVLVVINANISLGPSF